MGYVSIYYNKTPQLVVSTCVTTHQHPLSSMSCLLLCYMHLLQVCALKIRSNITGDISRVPYAASAASSTLGRDALARRMLSWG